MGMSSASQTDWTVDRLHDLPDDGNRYEIIDGVLYVTPSPRFLHQAALRDLSELLRPYAKARELDVMCLTADIRYSNRTLVQPDLFVYPRAPRKPIREWADVQPLQLVVEALSPSTRRRDRTVKRGLYQAQGVPEYWIVDIDARVIERWRPDSTVAEIFTTTVAWQPVAGHEPLHIDLTEYFRIVHGD